MYKWKFIETMLTSSESLGRTRKILWKTNEGEREKKREGGRELA